MSTPRERAERWFHEYGFEGPEDFEAVEEFAENQGFKFVYGGANKDDDWVGYPAALDRLAAEHERLREGLRHVLDRAFVDQEPDYARIEALLDDDTLAEPAPDRARDRGAQVSMADQLEMIEQELRDERRHLRSSQWAEATGRDER